MFEAHARVASGPVIPRQLPASPVHFVGRDDELCRLDAPVGGRGTVLVLTRTGGIGKTALALHWSRRFIERFPDGQLFAHLGAFDPASRPVRFFQAGGTHRTVELVEMAAVRRDHQVEVGTHRPIPEDLQAVQPPQLGPATAGKHVSCQHEQRLDP